MRNTHGDNNGSRRSLSGFTVDTQVFRELGELLVGRDSTALVELIKNAYDADATHVSVFGFGLSDPERGRIEVTDNGAGMNTSQFEKGFLRVASRIKVAGERRSTLYERRFTGAKGIGRLAAHKLARFVQIDSTQLRQGQSAERIIATIDWDRIEQEETLDDVFDSGAVTVKHDTKVSKGGHGTQISLQRLRRRWTENERARFFNEVSTYVPPEPLVSIPKSVLEESLFERAIVRDVGDQNDPGFQVELGGEFEAGEDYWNNLATVCKWVVEIDARPPQGSEPGVVVYRISPTKLALKENPTITGEQAEVKHPDQDTGPFFQARILIREGSKTQGVPKSWLAESSGIRIYMEGFRVLPYGERGDDWLGIDRDYNRRIKTLMLGEEAFGPAADENEGLLKLRNDSFLGSVFLTVNGSSGMRMLVNREGFVPEQSYWTLVELVKQGIDFSTRVRARESLPERTARSRTREQDAADRVTARRRQELRQAVESSVNRASALATEARSTASKGNIEAAVSLIREAAKEFSLASDVAERLLNERATVYTLASVGTQMTAFVHEIQGTTSAIISIERALTAIEEASVDRSVLKVIKKQLLALGELRRILERQATYFTDIGTSDSRRRRSRQPIHERFQSALRFVHYAAVKQRIRIINNVDVSAETPPMFASEVSVILVNILSNAIKASGEGGEVFAWSERRDKQTRLVIENTGARVELASSDRLFKPFVSHAKSADPALGQGMGMGLAITRQLLGEYGASISFVEPQQGYATAIEVLFEE